MRTLTYILGAALLVTNLAFAAPTYQLKDTEYATLKTAQPVPEGKKIEVIEFFMYHCPACNLLEPALSAWVKKQGDSIVFKRVHVAHNGLKDAEARMFLTLEAMNKAGELKNFDEIHQKLFKTWHEEHVHLLSDKQNIEWAEAHGIDKEKFLSFYNSPAILEQLKKIADKMMGVPANYQIDSTPTIVVDGRYQTNMAMVKDTNDDLPRDKLPEATLQVVDALIAKARAGQK